MGKLKNPSLGPFVLGMNNRVEDYALDQGDAGQAVRYARNVEFTDAGRIRTRRGAATIQAMTAPHSLAHDFYVQSSSLYQISNYDTFAASLVKVLSSNSAMSYDSLGDDVFCTNGTDILRLNGGTAYPIAPAKPGAISAATTTGSLLAGAHRITITYTDADGREGPASDFVTYDAAEGDGVTITLPAAPAGVDAVNLYSTLAEGTTLMWQGSTTPGTGTMTLTNAVPGRVCRTENKAVLPAGTQIGIFNGRLCTVDGDTLYYSLPYQYGLYDPVSGFIKMPDTISVFAPTQGGCYIVADKSYWLPGADMSNADLADVLPYGAAAGSAFKMPDGLSVGWYGDRGVVIGSPSGEVRAIQEDQVAAETATSAICTVIERDGASMILASFQGGVTSLRQHADYATVAAGVLTDV